MGCGGTDVGWVHACMHACAGREPSGISLLWKGHSPSSTSPHASLHAPHLHITRQLNCGLHLRGLIGINLSGAGEPRGSGWSGRAQRAAWPPYCDRPALHSSLEGGETAGARIGSDVDHKRGEREHAGAGETRRAVRTFAGRMVLSGSIARQRYARKLTSEGRLDSSLHPQALFRPCQPSRSRMHAVRAQQQEGCIGHQRIDNDSRPSSPCRAQTGGSSRGSCPPAASPSSSSSSEGGETGCPWGAWTCRPTRWVGAMLVHSCATT